MNALVITPVILPLGLAVAVFLLRRHPGVRIPVTVLGSAANLVIGMWLLVRVMTDGIQVMQAGGWEAPYGITFVADPLGAILVVVTGVINMAVCCYAQASIPESLRRQGYDATMLVLIAAVSGAFLTGDLFNLYVWFEVMLMASFGLLLLGGTPEQLKGGLGYVALNLISTILFVCAIGMTYAMTGTLNMADLHLRIRDAADLGWLAPTAMLFMTAFGIKSAVFPLFFWLPTAYHTPPVAVSAVFSGLLTKVGVYAMIRVFTLHFVSDTAFTHAILLGVAGLTMVTGVLGAAAQMHFRRILSFHIISQIGYMIMGLGIYTHLAITGTVFYLAHHMVVKTNLFLISGLAERIGGTGSLKRLGGFYASAGWLAALFFIPAFSLAGLPPLSGFWAKLILVKAGLAGGHYWVTAAAIVVGFLTLYSMTKIWDAVFWKPAPETASTKALSRSELLWMALPAAGMAAITVWIGLWPETLTVVATRASETLMDPGDYVRAVLTAGGRP